MPVVSVGDPRTKEGAYLTDGKRLYQVIDTRTVTIAFKRPELRIWVEDQSSFMIMELDANFSGMTMRLVEHKESDPRDEQ